MDDRNIPVIYLTKYVNFIYTNRNARVRISRKNRIE